MLFSSLGSLQPIPPPAERPKEKGPPSDETDRPSPNRDRERLEQATCERPTGTLPAETRPITPAYAERESRAISFCSQNDRIIIQRPTGQAAMIAD
jgi:hypothetical protein